MSGKARFAVARLGAGDLGEARALNALFAASFEAPGHYLGRPPGDEWLARLLAREQVVVLVARAEGKVLGGLVAYVLEKLERAGSEIYIYDLAVDAGHRRRGVATALIGHLQALAPAAGAEVIYVQADHGDDPAVALYTKLGTREDVMHFDIAVPGQ